MDLRSGLFPEYGSSKKALLWLGVEVELPESARVGHLRCG